MRSLATVDALELHGEVSDMTDDESRRAGAEITALAHAIEDLCRNSSGEMTASACLLVLTHAIADIEDNTFREQVIEAITHRIRDGVQQIRTERQSMRH